MVAEETFQCEVLLIVKKRIGRPRFMQGYGAYGLMLSLIWVYVSVLRLLALRRVRLIDERGAASSDLPR